ncbi:AAA family ATPase [Consotaella aegiceratis]|uniref:AAA family ATPase n=1 Tax=Consotaella aegiceratis TaxID=3097961 RepID=UPI002F420BEC
MIIVLNGYPGVGKLSIGRELAAVMDGRLLDIHSVYNIAFALTEFKSPEFKATVEKVEAIAHDLVLKLPLDQPVVLTTVLAGKSDWGAAEWQRIVNLGKARPPFCVVHVGCDLDENIRRIRSEERDLKRKPRDSDMARRNQSERKVLAGLEEENLLKLDTTEMSPGEAAAVISKWVADL